MVLVRGGRSQVNLLDFLSVIRRGDKEGSKCGMQKLRTILIMIIDFILNYLKVMLIEGVLSLTNQDNLFLGFIQLK